MANFFSAVRANEYGNVGFLEDWRRMNVMMTRPKRGLIGIGNEKTLSCTRVWSEWIKWADSCGVYYDKVGSGKEYIPRFLGDTLVGANANSLANMYARQAKENDAKLMEASKNNRSNSSVPSEFIAMQNNTEDDAWSLASGSPKKVVDSPKLDPQDIEEMEWDALYASDDEGEVIGDGNKGEDDEEDDMDA